MNPDIERLAKEAVRRYLNAVIYGTSHPEMYKRATAWQRLLWWANRKWDAIRGKFALSSDKHEAK